MTDPRNVAHDKRVQHEKKHHGVDINAGAEAKVQPGKKPHMEHTEPVAGHEPDQDEPIDKTESGREP